jgi:hypothetical protein
MAKLGLITVEDGILESQRQMMAFRTVRNRFHIPPGYSQIWQSILELPILSSLIPQLVVEEPWKDRLFYNKKSLFVVKTNDIYHQLVDDRVWVQSKVLDTWHITRGSEWCFRVLDAGWKSHLPFSAKVFLWRAMVGGLPLAMALKRRQISNGSCVFCTMIDEDSRHRFISCHVAKNIWLFISQLWGSLTRNILSLVQWIFIEGDRVLPNPAYKVVFDYLRYLGMWYIWTLRNGFLFDGFSGVSQHICRIRGKLIWQFS